MNKLAQLVFIPSPGIGHLASTVEIAKLLVALDDRLSVTVLVMNLPLDPNIRAYTTSLSSSSSSSSHRIQFIHLQFHTNIDPQAKPLDFFVSFIENHKPIVRDSVRKLTEQRDSAPLAGFVVDMLCTTMVDVANEFGVPTYMFYTSNAGFLGLMLHLRDLRNNNKLDIAELANHPDAELEVPSFFNPVPAKVLPSVVLDEQTATHMFNFSARYKEMKGILVNTFVELESHALRSLLSNGKTPQVYPVGPILNLNGTDAGRTDRISDIVEWLDHQPVSSVVFLCFGSRGHLDDSQVKEIARALEHSGIRFIWSLRQPPPKRSVALPPSDYTDLKGVLPQEFFDRTAEIGKVIGWAPQVTVLSHPAVGGFVSHCGWNSIMESLWHGVPIATWPLYAEQQLNAFEMVKELGLAVEIRLDYRRDYSDWNDDGAIVGAQEIEEGLKKLMEKDSDLRKRVKETSEKSKKALMNGGSSYSWLSRLISEVIDNKP